MLRADSFYLIAYGSLHGWPPLQKSCMAVGSLQLLKIIPTEIILAGKLLKISLFTSKKKSLTEN